MLRFLKYLLSSITLLLLSNLIFGQVPNTFSSGETISSSKINANFSFLADAMANGKVEAMMVCESFGKILSTNKFSFGKCESSDNSSESFRVGDWYNSRTTFTENANNITLEELMDGKWLLSSTASVNGADLFFFYKVSSD